MKWHKPTEHPTTGKKLLGIIKTNIKPEINIGGEPCYYDFMFFTYGDFFPWHSDAPITHSVILWAELPETL